MLSLIVLMISCKNIEDIHKNEYSASIGTGITDCKLGETGISSALYESNKVAISGSFEHHVKNWLYVGISASYSQLTSEVWEGDIYRGCGMQPHFQIGNNKVYNLYFLPTMKFNWMRKKYFTMYSRLSAGCTYQHENLTILKEVDYLESETLSKTFFKYQVSPIGIEVGSKHFRLFAEMGFGVIGVQSGIRIRY